jgi:hypothetical protein
VASNWSDAASSLNPKSMIQAAPSSARNTLARRRSQWAMRWERNRASSPHTRSSTSPVTSGAGRRSRRATAPPFVRCARPAVHALR